MSAPLMLARSLRAGSGTPEGAKAGNVGDIYIRTDTTTLYMKTSGAGTTTGWSAIAGGGGGGGSVTSVGVSVPGILSVSGTPVTTSGTIAIALANQNAKTVLAGPTSGSATTPAFRQVQLSDLAQSGATTGQIAKWDGTAWAPGDDAGASSGAPTAAQYVTLATDATLTNERVLTAGDGITLTDAGAGSTVTVALDALTGDVTTSGAAATIANDAVTNAKLANMAQSTIKGRASGAGTGDPTDLTATQATAILDAFVGDSGSGGTKGLVPAPATGDAAASKFLKADGTWTTPSGSGDVVGPASATDDRIATFNGTTGKLLQDGGTTIAQLATSTVGIVIDGAGSAISTGVKGFVQVPFACTITAVRMFADQSGSAVVDIWKDTYANFPPTVADTITASAKPTISAALKSEDTSLTGWTTSVSEGDVIGFNVDSAATITRLTLQLTMTR